MTLVALGLTSKPWSFIKNAYYQNTFGIKTTISLKKNTMSLQRRYLCDFMYHLCAHQPLRNMCAHRVALGVLHGGQEPLPLKVASSQARLFLATYNRGEIAIGKCGNCRSHVNNIGVAFSITDEFYLGCIIPRFSGCIYFLILTFPWLQESTSWSDSGYEAHGGPITAVSIQHETH